MQSEYLRQFLHMLVGSIVILLMLFFGVTATMVFCVAGFFIALALNYLIKRKARIHFIEKIIDSSLRLEEKSFPMRGPVMFFGGAILALAIAQSFFAALGAMCILVFGDGFSTLIGKKFGKIKISEKHTLEGTIGGVLVSFIVLATFLELFTALFASVTAMLSELLGIEDNITIPVTAAIVLSLVLI